MMTDARDDYARTNEVNDALIPLEVLREGLGLSRFQLYRKLKAHGIEQVKFKGGAAVRWGDVVGKITPHRKM